MSFWNKNTGKNFQGLETKFKEELKRQGVPSEKIDEVAKKFREKVDAVPLPKIAIIGFTGVGKSTTLNALFNAGQPTSDICACTQKEAPIIGDVTKYTGSKGSVIVYDMPGLGEDLRADQRHFETYRQVLPIVDVAVWTFHTGDRAMTPMQEAIQGLNKYIGKDFQKKLMFAINKADAIAPGESSWNQQLNGPSQEQRQNIVKLETYIYEKIKQVLPGWNGQLVTYSAKTRFHLEQLMLAMIETMPKERRWVLDSVADVADPREIIDPRFLEYINSYQKNM